MKPVIYYYTVMLFDQCIHVRSWEQYEIILHTSILFCSFLFATKWQEKCNGTTNHFLTDFKKLIFVVFLLIPHIPWNS